MWTTHQRFDPYIDFGEHLSENFLRLTFKSQAFYILKFYPCQKLTPLNGIPELIFQLFLTFLRGDICKKYVHEKCVLSQNNNHVLLSYNISTPSHRRTHLA